MRVLEPFSIYCTTCHARLRVRKPEALGTIVACPKCQAMVLVERSAAVKDVRDAQASSATRQPSPNENAYDQVDALFSDDSTRDESIDETTRVVDRPDSEHFDDAMEAAATLNGQVPIEPDSFAGVPPFDSQASEGTFQQWRPWIIAAGAGFLGVVGAIGVIRLMVEATVADGRPSVSLPPDTQNVKAAKKTTDSVAVSDSEVTTKVREPMDGDAASMAAKAEVPPQINVDTASAPETLVDDSKPARHDADVRNVPEPNDQFGNILAENARPEIGLPEEEKKEPRKTNVATIENQRGRPSPAIAIVHNHPPTLDASNRLHQVIPAMEFRDIPIYQFAEFMSDYMSVPITLRWESILHAGSMVGRQVDVSVREDTEAHAVLDQVFRPIRLIALRDGQYLKVHRRSNGDTSTTAYLVSDLVKSDYTIKDLSELIQQVVLPGSWKRQGGTGQIKPTKDGRLAIRHANPAHFEVVVLLEKLRVARGGRPLSTYPHELFQPPDRQLLLRELLSRRVAVRSNDSMRLTELFRQTGEAAGCVLLPDWIGLRDLGWSPNTEVQVATDEMSLAEMLEHMEDVLGLVYRGLDSRTLELTSPGNERTRHEFALYDLTSIRDNGLDAVAIGERIRNVIGSKLFDSVGAAVGFDPVGKQVVVRLPQSLHVLSRDFLNAWGG